MLSVIILLMRPVSRFIHYYTECHYAECPYVEYSYAECRYAERRYVECRGIIKNPGIVLCP